MNKPTFTLITGASSGIGRELARVCAREGRNLFLVARTETALEAIASELRHGDAPVRVESLPIDLSDDGAPAQVAEEADARGLEIDTVINNAGFGQLGPFHEMELDDALSMLRLNVLTLTELTRRFLPDMLERGAGRVLNVASTAAFQPGPFMALYYASKAYVLSFSEALSEETRGTGVTVTALCPGTTKTGFQERAKLDGSGLVRLGLADARSVAEVGYRAMMAGRVVVVPGLVNKLLAGLVRLSPRSAVRRVVRVLNLGHP